LLSESPDVLVFAYQCTLEFASLLPAFQDFN